ncbi:hypothetical protein Enr13x_37250 [Stieleria neptunia]|uniref:Uncharacterized protein n=1 Tax=Stieleria neptunia TaxID=2527979 RepID=A0A518HSP3_9BACT|nr:hypothetical protein Enr13x_37250 [Stieleria neptunia]
MKTCETNADHWHQRCSHLQSAEQAIGYRKDWAMLCLRITKLVRLVPGLPPPSCHQRVAGPTAAERFKADPWNELKINTPNRLRINRLSALDAAHHAFDQPITSSAVELVEQADLFTDLSIDLPLQ